MSTCQEKCNSLLIKKSHTNFGDGRVNSFEFCNAKY